MRKSDILAMRRELSARLAIVEHQLAYCTGSDESDRRAELEGYIRATREALRDLEATKSARLTR